MRGAITAMRLRATPQRYIKGQDYGWHRDVERRFLGSRETGLRPGSDRSTYAL